MLSYKRIQLRPRTLRKITPYTWIQLVLFIKNQTKINWICVKASSLTTRLRFNKLEKIKYIM